MKKFTYLSFVVLLIFGVVLTACGGGGAERLPQDSGAQAEESQGTTGDPVAGKELFVGTCSACHGPEGKGVVGLGKDMTTSEFIAGKTNDELVAFIKIGRDPSDPLNTTGVAMPPKGGNPTLDEEDLFDIVAFIRTIHE